MTICSPNPSGVKPSLCPSSTQAAQEHTGSIQGNLPDLATALVWIHAPKKLTHTESARKRFAFEEVTPFQQKLGI
jgi:RecG-like helicase